MATMLRMATPLNLVGQVFGRLFVLAIGDPVHRYGKNIRRWLCLCSCGNQCHVQTARLTGGNTTSCGCWKLINAGIRSTTHGATRGRKPTRAYRAWQNAIRRCEDELLERYPPYGGRGIKFCEQWRHDFPSFLHDMGDCPVGYSLERKDVNGNYEPSNCIWIPTKSQARNRTTSRWITHNGETLIATAWAERFGVSVFSLIKAVNRGRTMDQIEARAKSGVRTGRMVGTSRETNRTNRSNNVFVEFQGERLIVTDWARKWGVPPQYLRQALYRGGTMEAIHQRILARKHTP